MISETFPSNLFFLCTIGIGNCSTKYSACVASWVLDGLGVCVEERVLCVFYCICCEIMVFIVVVFNIVYHA